MRTISIADFYGSTVNFEVSYSTGLGVFSNEIVKFLARFTRSQVHKKKHKSKSRKRSATRLIQARSPNISDPFDDVVV